MQKLHDWKCLGREAGLDGKYQHECVWCKIIARTVSNIQFPPEFRSDLHPCDEMVVRYIMTI